MIKRSLLAIAIVLALAAFAVAQRPPEPGRYDMEWAQFSTGQLIDLDFGSRTVEVVTVPPGECPPTSTIALRDLEIGVVWCFLPNGSIDGSSGATGGGDVFLPNGDNGFDGFFFEGRRAQAQAPRFTGVGRRQAAPPPPSTLKVFITQPRSNETVSGTAWVVMWVEGTSGSSNVFTLSADGRQVRTETTSSRGPVSMPWDTRSVANGAHTLSAIVRDAAGNTGTTSITIIVRN